jgi:hypothetical protein
MKFTAIAAIVSATAPSLGLAAPALASPVRHSHTAKPAPQVTGTRLQSALLPASAFGDGFTVSGRLNTGNYLWSGQIHLKPSGLSCANFETYIYVGGFGNTAGATDSFDVPNPAIADYPNIVLGGDQAVLQFKSAKAAASFYSQAYTRYKQCQDFTESDPATELTNQSLATTTIDKNKAFQLIQLVVFSSTPALSFYQNTAVVLAGTNVYTIDDVNGTNDPISASLLGNLVNRVQALYKHH